MQKNRKDDIHKKKEKNSGDDRSEKTEEGTQKKNQEQKEERLKKGGEGEHSPVNDYIVAFTFAFGFTW